MTLEKISSGLPLLDRIVGGGLLKGGVYIVQGTAGTGKTILANQIAFSQIAAGRKVAYVTLLAESHARMLQQMELFSFYRENAVPASLNYVSAFGALLTAGLSGVVDVLTSEMRQRQASLIVLDGLVTAAGASGSPQDLKVFLGQIQAISTLSGCNTLLLNSSASQATSSPEQTMVDGILLLRQQLVRSRHERTLEVVKFRGARVLHGAHTFRIGDDGIALFPQLEALPLSVATPEPADERVSTGVPGLDDMLGGGYPAGSVTAITGPEGAGKTLLGLQFLAKATPGEPGLLFGLDESGEMADRISAAFETDLGGLRRRGALKVVGQPRFGESLDEVGYRLLDAVKQAGARRVFVDGLASIVATPAYEERGAAFFAALFRELRRAGATSLFSVRVMHDGIAMPPGPQASPLADNSVVLNVETQGQTTVRTVSIAKVQGSRHDVTIRQLQLTTSGLRVNLTDAEQPQQ